MSRCWTAINSEIWEIGQLDLMVSLHSEIWQCPCGLVSLLYNYVFRKKCKNYYNDTKFLLQHFTSHVFFFIIYICYSAKCLIKHVGDLESHDSFFMVLSSQLLMRNNTCVNYAYIKIKRDSLEGCLLWFYLINVCINYTII